MAAARPLRLLTIAGSDSGGGAGIQADLKTFAAHDTFGSSVVTSVTAQDTRGVRGRHDLAPAVVREQLEAILDDLPPAAIKVGMLGSAAVVTFVAEGLRPLVGKVPIVVDPVLLAGSGDPLLDRDAVAVLTGELLPLASVVTPNLPEAQWLAGRTGSTEELARALAATTPALVKGGHAGGGEIEDVLVVGSRCQRFRHPRLRPEKVHGTGCTLSAALAVQLARGHDLPEAASLAIGYVLRAIAGSQRLGGGQWILLHPPETESSEPGPAAPSLHRQRS